MRIVPNVSRIVGEDEVLRSHCVVLESGERTVAAGAEVAHRVGVVEIEEGLDVLGRFVARPAHAHHGRRVDLRDDRPMLSDDLDLERYIGSATNLDVVDRKSVV